MWPITGDTITPGRHKHIEQRCSDSNGLFHWEKVGGNIFQTSAGPVESEKKKRKRKTKTTNETFPSESGQCGCWAAAAAIQVDACSTHREWPAGNRLLLLLTAGMSIRQTTTWGKIEKHFRVVLFTGLLLSDDSFFRLRGGHSAYRFFGSLSSGYVSSLGWYFLLFCWFIIQHSAGTDRFSSQFVADLWRYHRPKAAIWISSHALDWHLHDYHQSLFITCLCKPADHPMALLCNPHPKQKNFGG